MRSLKQMWNSRSIAAALLSLAIVGAAGTTALAKSKGKNGISAQEAIEQAIASSSETRPQFFTINEVLAQRAGTASKRPIRLASIDPSALRGSFSGLPHQVPPSMQTSEPFGVLAFRAPEGLLWTKWRALETKVEREVAILVRCQSEPDHCPSSEAQRFNSIIAEAKARSGRARFEHVNDAVNSAIRYTSDLAQHGVPDLWSAPLAAFASGRGDCEDYAIAKYVALRQAGVLLDDLRIILVRHLAIGEAHAVLAARHDGRWFILDNLRAAVVEDTEIKQFMPLFALDQQGVKLLAASYIARSAPKIISGGVQETVRKLNTEEGVRDEPGIVEFALP